MVRPKRTASKKAVAVDDSADEEEYKPRPSKRDTKSQPPSKTAAEVTPIPPLSPYSSTA